MNKFKLALFAVITAGAVGCGGGGGGGAGEAVGNGIGAVTDTTSAAVGTANQAVTDTTQVLTNTHPSSDQDPEGIIEEATFLYERNLPVLTADKYSHLDCPETFSYGGAPGLQTIIPVHINNDNHKDFIIQYVCSQHPQGTLHNDDTQDTVVAYVSDENGSYREANQEVFGKTVVSVNGLGKYKLSDVNRDGKKDVVWALNQEDGRSSAGAEGWYNNGGTPVVLMSNTNGFDIQPLPVYSWFFALEVIAKPDYTDVILGTFTEEDYKLRYQNGMWTTSRIDPIDVPISAMEVMSYKQSTEMIYYVTKTGKEVMLSQVSLWDNTLHGYTATGFGSATMDGTPINYDVMEAEAVVKWGGWNTNGEYAGQNVPVLNIDGVQMAYANYDNICLLGELVPGGKDYVVAQVWGESNISGTPWKDGDFVVEGGKDSAHGSALHFYEIADDGSVKRVPTPINNEDLTVSPMGTMLCEDINGDGLADIALSPKTQMTKNGGRSGAPSIYMTDGNGMFNLLPQSDMPTVPAGGKFGDYWQAAGDIVDVDSDGDYDFLMYSTSQPYAPYIIYTH